MMQNKEITIKKHYPGLPSEEIDGFRFVILERFLSYDNEFSAKDGFILNTYFTLIRLSRSDSAAFGIDANQSVIEKVPLVVAPVAGLHLKKAASKKDSGSFESGLNDKLKKITGP